MYRQTQIVVEYPLQAQKELSPNKEAVGVFGMMKAIGTLNGIPESSLRTCWMNSISACIVSLMK
jgi:hypothetical protein